VSGAPGARLQTLRETSPAAFLARAEPWLMRAEVENNVILGLALALRERARPAAPEPWLATVEARGEVVACARASAHACRARRSRVSARGARARGGVAAERDRAGARRG